MNLKKRELAEREVSVKCRSKSALFFSVLGQTLRARFYFSHARFSREAGFRERYCDFYKSLAHRSAKCAGGIANFSAKTQFWPARTSSSIITLGGRRPRQQYSNSVDGPKAPRNGEKQLRFERLWTSGYRHAAEILSMQWRIVRVVNQCSFGTCRGASTELYRFCESLTSTCR